MHFKTNKEYFFFYKIPIFLFSLLPFFLVTGPFLSDLSISLISIIFLIYCYKKKNFSYFKNKYFYFFLIFWFYLIINSLLVNINLDSIKISFFFFRFGVFIIAVVFLLESNHNFMKYFFYCILFCFIILIIDGYFQYFNPSGDNLIGLSSRSSGRVSSFFGTQLILGSYLSRMWPIFFGLSILLINKKNNMFFLLILLFILSEALIFLSGERASFFFINLSAIFVIILSNKIVKLRLITLVTSLLLIIAISYLNPVAKNRIVDQTLSQMNLIKDDENKTKKLNLFTSRHTEHYISAYKMFLDNKILGVGVKNFRNFCGEIEYKSARSCSTHPHNTYIQLISETGIIGFSLFLFVFIYFCYFVIKHLIMKFKKNFYFTDFEICILSGLLIYLWPIVPTGNIFNNWLNIITILNLPFFIWSRKNNKLN